jgi:hypothetical protein
VGANIPEDARLRMFKNRMLKIMFGLKMDGVTGGCRKLHNDEVRDV